MKTINVDPGEVRAGDYVVLTGGRVEVSPIDTTVGAYGVYANGCFVPVETAAMLGAEFKRDVPPDTSRIPDEDGAVIRVHEPDDGYVYERRGGVWSLAAAQLDRWSNFEIQNMADKYGFTVLWPVPEPPVLAVGQVWRHEDGRVMKVTSKSTNAYADIWRAIDGPIDRFVNAAGLLAAGFTLDEETNQ